jgi:ABC-type glycerol-3-phosphate transport system permease component
VVLPQAVPGLITTAIFTFNESWSEYLFASILMSSGDKMTLSPGLSTFTSQTGVYYWGILMAAGVLVTLPVVAIFIALQRYLVAGWGGGALTG